MILLNLDFLFVVGHANKIANSKISTKLYCNKKWMKIECKSIQTPVHINEIYDLKSVIESNST